MTSDFSLVLLQWFKEYGRALPWRQTHDPYAIWLSEIILQQTRIQQGEAYWHRFMHRWPNVEALAQATEDEVLLLWQGLGYYSRARNLHAAARQIVEAGAFPNTIEGIRALKGVGPYTAAAIGSFAFNLRAAVVDGNVYRVLARHFGISTPINTTTGQHEFQTLAESLLPPSDVDLYNQALMDFGAIQCTPQSPNCQNCPLQESCVALRTGQVSVLPVKERKLKIRQRHLIYIYVRHEGQTAIHRRGPGDIWQGLWEPLLIQRPTPNAQHPTPNTQRPTPIPQGARLLCQGMRHVLTHQVITADLYLWEPQQRPTLPDEYIWINEADIIDYAIPRLIERLLEECHP